MSQKTQHTIIRDYSSFIAGYCGGVSAVLFGYPFDTVKVRVQLQSEHGKSIYNGPFDCVKQTIRREGLRAFYQGALFPVLSVGITRSVNMGIANGTKSILKNFKKLNKREETKNYLSGGLGGASVSLITTPIDNLRIKMQVQKYNTQAYRNSIDCAQKVISQQGALSLYNALAVTFTRNFIGCGAVFSSYYYLKDAVKRVTNKEQLNILELCTCGALSGMTFWILTLPLDSAKSRIQAQTGKNSTYKGTLDCLYQVIKNKGPRTLYNGLTPSLLKSIPTNIGFWAAYESINSLSETYNKKY